MLLPQLALDVLNQLSELGNLVYNATDVCPPSSCRLQRGSLDRVLEHAAASRSLLLSCRSTGRQIDSVPAQGGDLAMPAQQSGTMGFVEQPL